METQEEAEAGATEMEDTPPHRESFFEYQNGLIYIWKKEEIPFEHHGFIKFPPAISVFFLISVGSSTTIGTIIFPTLLPS